MQPFRPPPVPGAAPYSTGMAPISLPTPGTNPASMAMRGPLPRGPPPPMFAPGRGPPPASMGMPVPMGLTARPPPHLMDPGGLGPPRPLLQPPGMMHRMALPETEPLNVFVGKLPTDLNDSHVRNLLESCGHVVSWKRTADPLTNKPKAFGYCTYSSALDVLRALRLLNGFSMDSKQILIKVDTKTQTKLDEFTAAMPEALRAEEQARDEEVRRVLKSLEDERSGMKGGIQNDPAIWGDLLGVNAGATSSDNAVEGEKAGDRNEDEAAEIAPVETKVQQKMILTEIEKFRLAQEQREREQEQKRRDALRERLRREELADQNEPAEEIPALKPVQETQEVVEATRLETHETTPKMKSERKESNASVEESSERQSDNNEREKTKSRTRDRDREKDRDRRDRRDRGKDRDKDRSRERERRKRARSHSRSRSQERSSRRRRRSSRTHSRTPSRSRSRDRERHRDRERDRDRHHDRDRRRRRRHSSAADEEVTDERRLKRRRDSRGDFNGANAKERSPQVEAVKAPPVKVVMELKMPMLVSKKEKPAPQPTASLFKLEEETDIKPVRELIRIDFDAEEKQASALAQERAAAAATKISSRNEDVKTLINRIPTEKAELFAYPIDWTAVDNHAIVKTKMEPWVTKKVLEYLGEEDTTMIQFILTKLSAHAKPDVILDELELVLEDEAEVFVKLLWRKLGFEALRAGA